MKTCVCVCVAVTKAAGKALHAPLLATFRVVRSGFGQTPIISLSRATQPPGYVSFARARANPANAVVAASGIIAMASTLAGWAEQLAPWEKQEDKEELAAEALRVTGVAGAVIHQSISHLYMYVHFSVISYPTPTTHTM